MTDRTVLRSIEVGSATGKVVTSDYSYDYSGILKSLEPYWGSLEPSSFCFLEDLRNRDGVRGLGREVVKEALFESKRQRRLLLVFGFSNYSINDSDFWPKGNMREQYLAARARAYSRARQELQTLSPGTTHFEMFQQKLKNYYLGTGWFKETPLRWVLVEKV